jgi:hypothetical protein
LKSTDPATKAELEALDARINRLLPARYQHCYQSVPATSMGSAALKYDHRGRVAWGEIWTSFCDLALAGGPPHRGRLLEPVDPEAVAAHPEQHREVVEELDRAIRLVTNRRLVAGYAPGWVGVPCATGEEASWLRAAVVAENVSARRRGTVLQLPAGPDFRVDKEVKNVVVALAKVGHFWDGHLSAAQQSAFRDTAFPEPASAAEIAASSEEYQATVTLLDRGLCEVIGRAVDTVLYPGWVGVPCDGEEMAAWVLRATVVKGLLARREEGVLYLPVGVGQTPSATERVVAVVAATQRLWRVHAGGAS